MKKHTLTNKERFDRIQENNDRINEIADLCEKENRERTEEETREYNRLVMENQTLMMRMQADNTAVAGQAQPKNRDVAMREAIAAKQTFKVELKREVTPQTTAALEGTGIIRVQEQEMLKPLREGLIYDKLGMTVATGLSGTTLRWPKHGKAVARFANEGERLIDSAIDFSKLEVKPERMGVAIPVTREELESSEGIVDRVIREEMPASIADLVNDALLSTTATYLDDDGNEQPRKVVGPFTKAEKVNFAGAVPTRKELLKMKSKVAASGVKMFAPCWVMTEDMKAELEDTKVDAGSGRFVCENGMILGYPVYTSSAIGAGNVGFGDWSYQASGFFGGMSIIVDPYTLARNNATDFVLNGHFATVTLREEAFVLGVAKA